MKKVDFIKALSTAALAALLCFGLVACNGSGSSDEQSGVDVHDTADGVAATVNGIEIGENAVTSYIEDFRASASLTDEAAWAQWMADADYTPETVREEVINYYIDREIVRLAAADQGVSADPAKIDEQVTTMRSYYDSDDDWQQALTYMGLTEDQYREMLELSFLQQGLMDAVATKGVVDDDELLMYAQIYGKAYDGAKKSSHILFAASDEATAQQVLDQINNGEITFEDAAAQYSMDSSAADGGNVGWDAMSSFVTEYREALDQLGEGEVSGLVVSEFGIHIIKCTEVYNAPEEITSIDDIPADFKDAIYATLENSGQQSAYTTWLDEFKKGCDIVINPMPEGLSYDVDMTGYVSSTDEDAEAFNLNSLDMADEGAEATDAGEAGDASDADAQDAAEGEAEGDEGAGTSSQPGEVSAS